MTLKKSFSLRLTIAALLLSVILLITRNAMAHCQVPCGIYDDHARIHAMLEDSATVEKALKELNELAGKTDVQSKNQFVRWVNNKEIHAENVIATMSNYFLTQRVKPEQKDYAKRLQKHHAVILAAMKTKQNSDQKFGEALTKSIQELGMYYPKPDSK